MAAGMNLELDTREHMAVFTEASAALSSAGLEAPVVLDTITNLLVAHIGDSAVVYLLADDGVEFELGSVSSRNPLALPVAQELEASAQYRIDGPGLVARCARDKVPLMYPRVDLREIDLLPPGYRDVVADTPIRSLAYVPLCTESETLGVLTVTRVLNAREPMTDADLELLCDLGELATRSLANSRLHRDLADATALFETAFRSAPIGMALVSITDDPGRIVRVNDAMTMATGHSGHELLSMHVTALFPAHSRDRVAADLRAAATGGTLTSTAVGPLLRRDGTEVTAHVVARAVNIPGRIARIGMLQVQVPPAAVPRGSAS
ncbi:MAG: GAF domain-containing protein [Acidimicrobiia bacterium]|nr:GAF domain-containing protein [Acidimicrobiia bacterium]